MSETMQKAILNLYSNKDKFILIGLTGQIGSGCSTTAKFMSKTVDGHNLPIIAIDSNSSDDVRKKYIIQKYYKENWKPFDIIMASDVITSFILESTKEDIEYFFTNEKFDEEEITKTNEKCDKEEITKTNKKFDKEEITKINEKFKNIQEIFKKESGNVSFKKEELYTLNDEDIKKIKEFLFTTLSEYSKEIKQCIIDTFGYRTYTKIYQTLGDNLRTSGKIISTEKDNNSDNIYIISERINYFIKVIKKFNENENKPTHIVIDAFRNPIEMSYFRERYSSFFLFTINADEEDINDRLYKKSNLTKKQIEEQREKENPKNIFKEYKYFISQNIKSCIEKGDIHISNTGKANNNYFLELYGQIIKYVSLIQHPGLITPSQDEKMMQIANTAKLNSGCLSRQVGASVTNSGGSIIAVGWNSVAQGQTPCLLRSKDELIQTTQSNAYSTYEKRTLTE